LLLLPRAPAQENAASDVLLQCAFSCSPWVEATAPGICTFELRGAPAGVEKSLAERVIAHLESLNLKAAVGFATNADLALLAAQCAAPILAVGSSSDFAAHLPLEALGAPDDMVSILRKWGVHTLGDFTRLRREEVTARLGTEARRLWARAAGRFDRLLKLAFVPPAYEEFIEFENEVETLEPLLFILRRFLEQLTLRLEAVHRVPEEISLRLTLASHAEYRRLFRIPSPTSNVEVLFRVLHTHLESFTTESPIVALHLEAKAAVPQSQQFGLFETALRDPNHFFETLARLNALLGPESAGTPILADTHKPDAFQLVVPDFTDLESNDSPAVEPPDFGLPLRRFRPPITAQVLLAEQVPAAVTSAQVSGAVWQARGPFQASGAWWDTQRWATQEWDVQLADGGIYRLSRGHEGWRLEGVYD
jgi:protein ImuB